MNKSSARLHAVAAAYMSISTGVTGIALGLVAANAEFSMSLYGMAIVGAVDVSASCFVLLVYQATCADAYFEVDNPHRKRKETLYSYFIGGLMAMMGTFLAIDSCLKLLNNEREHFSLANQRVALVASIFTACCSLSLSAYKFVIAETIDSAVVFVDALTSLCSGLVSLAALIIALNPSLEGWVDGLVGMLLAVYTLCSGIYTMVMAKRALVEMETQQSLSDRYEKMAAAQFQAQYSYQHNAMFKGSSMSPLSYPEALLEDRSECEEDFEMVFEATTYRLPFFHSFFSAMNPILDNVRGSAATGGSPYQSIKSSDSDEDDDLTFEA